MMGIFSKVLAATGEAGSFSRDLEESYIVLGPPTAVELEARHQVRMARFALEQRVALEEEEAAVGIMALLGPSSKDKSSPRPSLWQRFRRRLGI